MIKLKCCGCHWDGIAPDHFAGLRVVCKRCRYPNTVPDTDTKEFHVEDFIAKFDPTSSSSTIGRMNSNARRGGTLGKAWLVSSIPVSSDGE
jgi:hypothetical protein